MRHTVPLVACVNLGLGRFAPLCKRRHHTIPVLFIGAPPNLQKHLVISNTALFLWHWIATQGMIGPFRTPTDILLWQFCKAYTAWCEWKVYNIEFANWISNQKICNCEFCTTYNHWLAPIYNLFTKQSNVARQMYYNTKLHRVGCEPHYVSISKFTEKNTKQSSC